MPGRAHAHAGGFVRITSLRSGLPAGGPRRDRRAGARAGQSTVAGLGHQALGRSRGVARAHGVSRSAGFLGDRSRRAAHRVGIARMGGLLRRTAARELPRSSRYRDRRRKPDGATAAWRSTLTAAPIGRRPRWPRCKPVDYVADRRLPGVDTNNWYGLFVPAKISPEG